jgi:tetratricopeptide (TPR) repeat protein
MPQFRTLAIRISVLDDGRLWAVVSGDGGQEDNAILVPDDPGFAALQHGLVTSNIDAAGLQTLGQQLFDTLFPDVLRRVYDGSAGQLAPDARLRLLLTFPPEAAAFASLPWEYLHDPARGALAQRGISIIRALAQATAPQPMAITPPLRVLLSAAQTDPPVDVRRELIAAESALKRLGEQVVVTVEPRLTIEKLREHLRDGYHVWHYLGHGRDGQLLLEDSYGDADPVEANVLAATLSDSGVRLAVLSACKGATVAHEVLHSVAPALVAAGVPAAVAMQFVVTQESTQTFATEFYRALARAWPIDACVSEGRKALLDLGGGATLDWGIPVVYTRAEDGVLFAMPDAEQNPLAAAQIRLAAIPTDRLPDPSALPVGSRMPFARNPLFVGREQDLQRVAEALVQDNAGGSAVATAAVTGMAGVGKTSLVIECAHRYGQFFGGVFWVRCADPAAIAADVAACGGPDGMNLPGWADMKTADQVALVQAAWEEPLPRLLIFDGCEDEEMLAAWRPPTGGCRVIVTSLRANWSAVLAVRPAPLDVLPRPTSVELLRKYRPDLAENDAGLAGLAEELGDLPLALRLAGSYLETYRDDPHLGAPATLLAELRGPHLLAHEALAGHELGGGELSVGRTFALSLGQLDQADPVDVQARTLLSRAAYLAPGVPIPRDLLLTMPQHGGLDAVVEQAGKVLQGISALWGAKPAPAPDPERTASRAVSRLIALGLLEQHSGSAVSIHRLVAAFAQQSSHDAAMQGRIEQEMLAYLIQQQDSAGFVQPLGDRLAHIVSITQAALARDADGAAELANRVGLYMFQNGIYGTARTFFTDGLAFEERAHRADQPMSIFILSNLGTLLRTQGDLTGARTYFERAVTASEQAFGPDKPQTAMALNSMGLLLQAQGDLPGARTYFERAVKIWENTIGPENPTGAGLFNNLGTLLQDLGDLDAARPYLERTLQIFEKTIGPEHPQTAAALNNMGLLLQVQGDLAGARPYLERALAIWEKVLGPEHPQTATALNNVGWLLKNLDDLAGARTYLERALAIWEHALGPDSPQAASALNNLGLIMLNQNDLASAGASLERALAIRERVLGAQHHDTAMTLNNIGALHQKQGDLAAARPLYERALATMMAALGPQHADTLLIFDNLISLLQAQNDLAAARAQYDQLIAQVAEQLGANHAFTQQLQALRDKLNT